jgi:hypothetical protein
MLSLTVPVTALALLTPALPAAEGAAGGPA